MYERLNAPGLSVVVTAYTETVAVIETVERLIRSDATGVLKEIIIVVAPAASAETKRICEELTGRFNSVKTHYQRSGPGVGRALREGMLMATQDLIAIMSGDLETEPEAVIRMYRKMLDTGADVVIGSRWLKGGGFKNYNPVKLVCNWAFQKVFQIIYRTRINDLTYGFKLLRSEVANSIPWESTHHTIYIETTIKPLQSGYHIEQVPTVWIGRREGKSVNTFFRNFEYVKLGLRIKGGSVRQRLLSRVGV
jgi:glycosyltransferase involved in cell wall biosynthesis